MTGTRVDSEQTPLISSEGGSSDHYEVLSASTPAEYGNTRHSKKQTPLPKLQLFTLLYIAFCEPAAGTVIYPFVVRLVTDTGITGGNQAKTGFYAGIIVSVAKHDLFACMTDTRL